MAFRFRRAAEELGAAHQINVTPFIDVMLVLLVIFMITAPLSAVRVPLDLPTSSARAQAPTEPPLVLSVQRDLSLSLGNAPVARAALGAALLRATRGNRDTRIYLRADQAIRYGDLMGVMDLLREAGYLKVALVGREASPSAAPGSR